MRLISYLTMFLFAVLLSACGGGGGSPGLSSGPVSAFSVVAPAAVTLQVGLQQSYAIKGGVKPYSVLSNDPAIAVGWVGGDDALYVGTILAGRAIITVVDAKGSKFDLAVTSGSSRAFFTTAASAITITPGVAYAQTYTLGGGTGPYTATSSFTSVATAVVNGNRITITGVQISTLVSTITIRDAADAILTVAVTVGTVPLAVNPTDPTISTGSIFRSIITGGTPPYRAIVLDNCLTDVKVVQGNLLEAKGNKPCSGSAITVVDASNQTINFNVTVNVGSSALQLAPSAFAVPESDNTPNFSLTLYGANSGPLKVFTTNPSLLAPQAPVSNEDGTFTIPLTGGNTCVTFIDNTNPRDDDYTDVAAAPAVAGQLTSDVSTNNVITITVLDSTGRQGTSVLTIKDNVKNGVGCN